MKLLSFYSIIKKFIKSFAAISSLLVLFCVSGCYYEKIIEPGSSSGRNYAPKTSGANGYYNQPNSQRPANSGGYPPASRYYSNPYAIQPQNSYPYYDQDQYYRPPTAYGTDDVPTASYDRY